MCVCVCVREREREAETETETGRRGAAAQTDLPWTAGSLTFTLCPPPPTPLLSAQQGVTGPAGRVKGFLLF